MHTLVNILPSFNISSPTSEIFHKPSTCFHQASIFFFTKVQLNIFLQYRMLDKKKLKLGEKMSKVYEKFQRLVKKVRSLVKQYWSLVKYSPKFACWEYVTFYWSFELLCISVNSDFMVFEICLGVILKHSESVFEKMTKKIISLFG
jgi:hypothetical protein